MKSCKIRPFEMSDCERAWDILQQFARWNFDDSSPATFDDFAHWMEQRITREVVEAVISPDGQMVGMIAVAPGAARRDGSFRSAFLHGICFDRSVHGTPVTLGAIQSVLDRLYAEGVEKIAVSYAADNVRIRKFLRKLGAIDEGYLKFHVERDGKPVDFRLCAFFKGQREREVEELRRIAELVGEGT